MTPPPLQSPQKPQRLLTFTGGGWIFLLSLILSIAAVFWTISHHRPTRGDGRNLETYGFNLTTTLIPKEQLIPAGLAKDALQALINPDAITVTAFLNQQKNARSRFLVDDDRIIAVTLQNQSRAYPLSMMSLHEIANDTLGGVPIAITYSPLCDSIVVFDRTCDNRILELGVSGILYQSNLIMFDRQADPSQESLWSQLQFKAIAGPAAEKKQTLTRIPYQLTTWGRWSKEHPDGTLITGNPQWKKEYLRKRYATYFATPEVKFPVTPLWRSQGGLHPKTPILAVFKNHQWHIQIAEGTSPSPPSADTLCAFMFAWYAQHPESILPTLISNF